MILIDRCLPLGSDEPVGTEALEQIGEFLVLDEYQRLALWLAHTVEEVFQVFCRNLFVLGSLNDAKLIDAFHQQLYILVGKDGLKTSSVVIRL